MVGKWHRFLFGFGCFFYLSLLSSFALWGLGFEAVAVAFACSLLLGLGCEVLEPLLPLGEMPSLGRRGVSQKFPVALCAALV